MSKKFSQTPESGISKTKMQLVKELDELTRLCAAQKITIDSLNKEIDRIEKQQIPKNAPSIELDEVAIAKLQLKRLGEKALSRQLNNDEAKLFEIFAKIVQADEKLAQNRKHAPTRLRDVSNTKLIEIAGKKLSTDE